MTGQPKSENSGSEALLAVLKPIVPLFLKALGVVLQTTGYGSVTLHVKRGRIHRVSFKVSMKDKEPD